MVQTFEDAKAKIRAENSTGNSNSSGGKKRSKLGARIFLFCLYGLVGITAVYNSLPYLEFCKDLMLRTTSVSSINIYDTIIQFIWSAAGILLFGALQLGELIGNLEVDVKRATRYQIRVITYACDVWIVNEVYPVFQLPIDWFNVGMMGIVLFALEFMLWVVEQVKDGIKK
jgi:hypothetical protein